MLASRTVTRPARSLAPSGPTPSLPTSHHWVQLFDEADTLGETVAEFVQGGLAGGDGVLVVATCRHWLTIASRLRARGVMTTTVFESGQLVVRDASDTLARCSRHGRPERFAFEMTVGAHVRSLVQRFGRLRIYGEMVDLLAAEADFKGAQQLEELWNDLGTRVPFTLLCGYSAVRFGDARTATALSAICACHTQVRTDPRDLLGTFLVRDRPGASPLPR